MNILDISDQEVKKIIEKGKKLAKSEDKLEILYELQKDLCKQVNPEVIGIGVEDRKGQEEVKKYIFYTVEELMELSNKMKLRPWVKTEYIPDINELYDELADAFLMFLLICISMGVSVDTLFEISVKKYAVNKFRYETGY